MKKEFTRLDVIDYTGFLLREVATRTRLERNMTPFESYIDEWIEIKENENRKTNQEAV